MSNRLQTFTSNAFSRAIVLGVLILILQIPIEAIRALIFERSKTEQQAKLDIESSWGRNQLISGPLLTIPYRPKPMHVGPPDPNRPEVSAVPQQATFVAKNLKIDADIRTEERYRGIFRVPVYSATVHISGFFDKPSFSHLEVRDEDVLWNQAAISIGVKEPGRMSEPAIFRLDGTELESHAAQAHELIGAGTDALRVYPFEFTPTPSGHRFEWSFTVNGSSLFEVLPLASNATVSMSSSWPHPGFVGGALPVTREVTSKGFRAEWKTSQSAPFPTAVVGRDRTSAPHPSKSFGVSLVSPVDTYRMNERIMKYQLFIIFLTFLTFYIFETFNRFLIHPIQYLLVGAALCLFYLLTLSFSEHIGFGAAYTVASCAAVSLVWFYSCYILHSGARGAVLAAILGSLYSYFYVVLQQEDYALLLGSIGLTLILAAIMYITRNIDWYKIGNSAADKLSEGA